MGINSGDEPNVDQGFILRVCHALDLRPWQLAKALGMRYKDFEPLLDAQRWQLAEMYKDDLLWQIMDLVTHRTAQLMAIRLELNKKLQKDRTAKAAHLQRFAQRDKKSSPRS